MPVPRGPEKKNPGPQQSQHPKQKTAPFPVDPRANPAVHQGLQYVHMHPVASGTMYIHTARRINPLWQSSWLIREENFTGPAFGGVVGGGNCRPIHCGRLCNFWSGQLVRWTGVLGVRGLLSDDLIKTLWSSVGAAPAGSRPWCGSKFFLFFFYSCIFFFLPLSPRDAVLNTGKNP